jgi:hypothetical protein
MFPLGFFGIRYPVGWGFLQLIRCECELSGDESESRHIRDEKSLEAEQVGEVIKEGILGMVRQGS